MTRHIFLKTIACALLLSALGTQAVHIDKERILKLFPTPGIPLENNAVQWQNAVKDHTTDPSRQELFDTLHTGLAAADNLVKFENQKGLIQVFKNIQTSNPNDFQEIKTAVENAYLGQRGKPANQWNLNAVTTAFNNALRWEWKFNANTPQKAQELYTVIYNALLEAERRSVVTVSYWNPSYHDEGIRLLGQRGRLANQMEYFRVHFLQETYDKHNLLGNFAQFEPNSNDKKCLEALYTKKGEEVFTSYLRTLNRKTLLGLRNDWSLLKLRIEESRTSDSDAHEYVLLAKVYIDHINKVLAESPKPAKAPVNLQPGQQPNNPQPGQQNVPNPLAPSAARSIITKLGYGALSVGILATLYGVWKYDILKQWFGKNSDDEMPVADLFEDANHDDQAAHNDAAESCDVPNEGAFVSDEQN